MTVAKAALTTKQSAAVAAAKPGDKAQVAAAFRRQNALSRMPRASAGPRGVMPDVTKYHFGQTPASSNVIAPRGFGYYDAFAHDPKAAVTAYSVGPATGITGSSRVTVSTDPVHAVLMLVVPAITEVQAIVYKESTVTPGTLDTTLVRSPQLQQDAPESAIPTRCSLRIRNVSPNIIQGGTIRTLRITTGVDASTVGSVANLDAFCDQIRNHERTRSYSGAAIASDFQINSTVVDQSKATSFTDWLVTNFQPYLEHPSFTPIAILFEPFTYNSGSQSDQNAYEVTIRSQFLARYQQGSMLANLAHNPPAVGDKINQARDAEEKKGSALQVVKDMGALALHDGKKFLSDNAESIGLLGELVYNTPAAVQHIQHMLMPAPTSRRKR